MLLSVVHRRILSTNVRISSTENNQKWKKTFVSRVLASKWNQSFANRMKHPPFPISPLTHTHVTQHNTHYGIAFRENFPLREVFEWRVTIECDVSTAHPANANTQRWDVVPPSSAVMFLFAASRRRKLHDCNKTKKLSDAMELFLYVSKPLWFDPSCSFCTPAVYSL